MKIKYKSSPLKHFLSNADDECPAYFNSSADRIGYRNPSQQYIFLRQKKGVKIESKHVKERKEGSWTNVVRGHRLEFVQKQS